MKLLATTVVIVLGMAVLNTIQEREYNKVTRNNMTFYWKVAGDRLHCKMNAPTKGWVAIGFNTKDELAGTNLVMGAVIDGKTVVEDRHTVRPGHYPTVASLGGTSAVTSANGIENDHYTTVEFSLPLKAVDQYHHDLEPGNVYTLLMAYSREDDFLHHSTMRTSIQLTL